MFLRKNKIAAYGLSKFYFFADSGEAVNFESIRADFLTACLGLPINFSLNYASDRSISSLDKFTHNMTYGDLEAFDCSDENGSIVFSLGRAGSAFGSESTLTLFECFVVSPEATSFEREILVMQKFAQLFSLYYGYIRRLPADFSPASEVRIKTGFFSKSVQVQRIQDSWILDPKTLIEGAIKGFYPINFWRENVLCKLSPLGFDLAVTVPRGGGIVQFDEAELRRLQRNHPQYEKYIFPV